MRREGQNMRMPSRINRLSSTSAIYLFVGVTAYTVLSADVALAANECGPIGPTDTSLTCTAGTYTGPSPNGNAIEYFNNPDFTFNFVSGTVITGVGEDPVLTNNSLGHGVYIRNDTAPGAITVNLASGVVISANGSRTKGVFVRTLGNLTINSSADISVTSPNVLSPGLNQTGSAGLFGWNADAAGDIHITQNFGSTISIDGNYSYGLYALNNDLSGFGTTSGDAIVDANGKITVVNGSDSYGAVAWVEHTGTGDALAQQGKDSVIQVQGDWRDAGIYALNYSTGTATARAEGQIDIDSIEGSGAAAVTLGGGDAHVFVAETAIIRAKGLGDQGVLTYADATGNASAEISGTIASSGENGSGVRASVDDGSTRVIVNASGDILGGWEANPAHAFVGYQLTGTGIEVKSGASGTSYVSNAGRVGALSDRAIIDIGRLAVYNKPGNFTLDNSGTLTGFIELADGGTNLVNNLSGGNFIIRHFADRDGDGTRDTKAVSISDFGEDTSSFINNVGATVRLGAVSGNTTTDNTNYYNVTAGIAEIPLDPSFYDLNRDGLVQGQFTNLGLFDNRGLIDLTGTTTGNSLVMTSNAAAGGAAGTGIFRANGGNLRLNAVLNAGQGVGLATGSYADTLTVDQTELGPDGPTTITVVRREGIGARTPGNGILLVEVRNKAASAPGVFVLDGDFVENGEQRIANGLYSYNLNHNGVGTDIADGNWYLRNIGFSPSVPTYQDYPHILTKLIEPPTLVQRVGNRYWQDVVDQQPQETVFCKDPEQNFRCSLTPAQATYYASDSTGLIIGSNGIWGRINGGHGHYESDASTISTSTSFNHLGLQTGYDWQLQENDNGSLIGGINLSYAHYNAKTNGNRLSGDAYGIGTSLTWYGLDGLYVDGQANLHGIWSDINNQNLGALKQDHRAIGYNVSLEVGKRMPISEGFTLIPQAQLIYSSVDFKAFTDNYGLTVDLNNGDSLRGRLGLAAEYEDRWTSDTNGKSRMKAYGIVNIYNEFLDGTSVSLNGQSFSHSPEKLWGGVGIGGEYAWQDDRYALYGEVAANTSLKDFGDSYELRGNIGLKVKW